MSIRHIEKNEYARVCQIAAYCFPHIQNVQNAVEEFLSQYVETEYTLGYFDEEDVLMAQLICFPFMVYMEGKEMNMGGIAVVSSMPEGRHGGRISSLLKESLRIMRDKGQVVSMLGPFSVEFYRKYGYEIGFERMEYKIPVENLRSFCSYYPMYAAEDKELSTLNMLYDQFAKKHNGCTIRDEFLWKEFTIRNPMEAHSNKYIYICKEDGKAKGYIIYTIQDRTMYVNEIIYEDVKVLHSILAFVYSHQAQIHEATFSTPLDDSIQYILPNPRVKREISSGMMFRVVDIREALRQRRITYGGKAAFNIKIEDHYAPWNQGIIHVEADNGDIKVTEGETYDVFCDIQTFSQIFIGYLTPLQAYELGKLSGKIEAAEEMEYLFEKSFTYNNNPF